MNYIKSLHIEGFKKFEVLDIQFNEHMNILIGENEAGKSTILEAVRIVLNQQYRNTDKSILRDLFNTQMVETFYDNPSIDTLPRILIEIELSLDPNQRNPDYFYGEVYGKRKSQEEKFGICFECKFDEELGDCIKDSITEGKIPYEYYSLTWNTFANHPYRSIKKPLSFLSVDTTNSTVAPSFNYYNRTLFTSKYDEMTRTKAKNDFRVQLEEAFQNVNLPDIDENRKFGVDSKKVVLETILSVYEDSVALENRGSGMESLIKTQIALDKRNKLDVILIEEPENHLCFSTLHKMLQEILKKQNDSQIIVTTHNSMIASRLNLNHILWIKHGSVMSLAGINKNIARFFVKADDNSILQLLLSTKIILVEGATEFLLLPKFYEKITESTIEKDKVTIISCNGISYKKYLSIAENTGKRVAVLTDNDKKNEKIVNAIEFNEIHHHQRIFMDENTDNWTWEACIYHLNKDSLKELTLDERKSRTTSAWQRIICFI